MIKDKILEFMKSELEKPIFDSDLAVTLEIHKSEYAHFFTMIDEMVEDGLLIKTKKGKVGTPEMYGMVTGKIQTTQRGFGFLIVDGSKIQGRQSSGKSDDVFIPASLIGSAMNGDRVMVKLSKASEEGKRGEGEVIKILERANTEIVGTLQETKSFGFVIADEKKIAADIFVPKGAFNGAKDNDKVVVKIVKWPEDGRKAEGRINEVLGAKGDPGVDILSIIRKFNLPEEFPRKVEVEAERISEIVSEDEIKNRVDLRDEVIVTIDGPDAKDLDDAVAVKKLENGNYELGVHIADVTYYVKEGSKIGTEALKRGTSVYLVDKVVPMLPRRLSNGICSLNPNVDRLTLSINMEIDGNGNVVNHKMHESVIKTKHRMVYDDVSDIIEGKNLENLTQYEDMFETFKMMETLASILRGRRNKRGAIDFDFPEAKIITDELGKPIEIKEHERRVSNKIIEEFMLVANETVAEHMFWLEIPFVYRIHETPSEDKIISFNKFIHNFGYSIKGNLENVHPKEIQSLISSVKGKKEEHIISRLMLRSLKQAKYSPDNDGHFGLAAKYYCHFTSPIRRYPDLQIHRIIREMIQSKLDKKRISRLASIVDEASIQSSDRERYAEQAERDAEDMKKAEYMLDHIGEEFNGIISSVTSFGIFIELENTVEGLIRMMGLKDDYYDFDEDKLQLVGSRNGKIFKIGDEIKIRVEKIDVDLREIDFEFIQRL
jgi:ribonuclease R